MKFDYLVIAGGDFPPVSFVKRMNSLCQEVVVVDRGLELASRAKVPWSVFVGDQDSLNPKLRSKLHNDLKITYPQNIFLSPQKSLSDLEWTLNSILTNKKKTALVLAAHRDHEGRTDHLFANLLLALKWPGQIFLADEKSWILGIKNKDFTFKTSSQKNFSLISPHSFSASIKGAEYPIQHAKIISPTHGLSNRTKSDKRVRISIKGSALLFVSDRLK